jgi:fatty acid-binding protein DegV
VVTVAQVIGICTDSSAQLPPDLVARLGIEVVPLIVTVDGHDRLDGVDLQPDQFWALYADGHRPAITTCDPDPGQFAAAYEDLIERGCTEILSVHVAASVAGALKAARLAAHSTSVPVRVVDTASAGFGVGCAAWAAAEIVERGGTLDAAAAAAERAAATLGHLLLLPRPNGDAASYDLVRIRDGGVEHVGAFESAIDAINQTSARAVAWGPRLRVAVGHSDVASEILGDAVEGAVEAAASVFEIVRFRIGPSMGALTGPGAVSCVMCPIE